MVTLTTEQLSVVIGVPRLMLNITHELFAVTTILAGALIVGNEVSFTVTVCVAVLVLPLKSVTVQSTVVVPTG